MGIGGYLNRLPARRTVCNDGRAAYRPLHAGNFLENFVKTRNFVKTGRNIARQSITL